MKKYSVTIDVIYSDTVEAETEEDAIEMVMNNCPYDNDASVEPYVEEVEE